MKRLSIIGISLMISVFPSGVFADTPKGEIPPWMEDVKVKGRSTYLIPKGAKREIIGAQVIVEPPNEYVARRIYEIERYVEERLRRVEEGQEGLKKEFEEIKEALNAAEKRLEGKADKEVEKAVEKEAAETAETESITENVTPDEP